MNPWKGAGPWGGVPRFTWAGKPAASSYPVGQPVFITDIGNGTYFFSDGLYWRPISGVANIFSQGAPVLIPPGNGAGVGIVWSSNVGGFNLVTTTFGANDWNSYPVGFWCYFLANTFNGASAAGYYWTVMSSSSAGVVYQDYWNGAGRPPAAPTSPTAWGAGATTAATNYTTVSPATDYQLWSVSVPAGLLLPDARLRINHVWGMSNSAVGKRFTTKAGTITLDTTSRTTVNVEAPRVETFNTGRVDRQQNAFNNAAYLTAAANFGVDQIIYLYGQFASGQTEWLGSKAANIELIS